jgi:type I restriction enzyme, S subunit
VVSDNWKSDLLGNVATLQRGFDLPHRLRRSGKVPLVTSSGVEGTHDEAKVKGPGVVTGRYGTIGEVFFVDEDFWPHNTTLYVRDFHGNNPLFISYLLRTIDFHMHSGKTGVPGVNRNDLHEITVSIPLSVTEQKAIAEALSDADALIEALEQLIAKKRQVKQGAMQELLTGKRRLPGFMKKWATKLLGDIAHIQTGGRNNQDKVEDGEYPFFVRSATIERINTYSYDCEAILVPGEGNIGSIFHYINGRFDVHQRVYAITQFQSNISAKFVYLYIAQYFGKHALKNTVKATVDSLRLPTFLNFEVLLPPTKEEQAAIAEILSDMDAEIAALEAKLAKARQVKQGMMQELLTGQVRLV